MLSFDFCCSGESRGVDEWLSQAYDEADIENVYKKRMSVGAVIVEEMRAAIFRDTQFRCSAGISHNKVLFSVRLCILVREVLLKLA